MKICFFLENNKAGGLDTFVKNLLIYWPNANDKLILFYNDSHPGIKFLKIHFKNKNIKILKYRSFEKIYDKLTIIQKIQRYIKNIFLFNHKINYFYKLFKKNKFDRILFIQGGYPGGQSSNAAIFAWDKFSIHKPWFNFHNFAAETRKWDFFREILNFKISNKIEGFISVSKVCLKSINKIKYFRKLRQKYIYNFGANCLFSRKQGYLNRKIFTVNFSSPAVLYVNQTGQVFFIFFSPVRTLQS